MDQRVAAAGLLLLLGAGPAQAEGLSSPLVNRAIYRAGAIQRTAAVFARWTVVCDEIAALRQRFCSLRSATTADTRGQRVAFDVSTGDDGKPAMLVHLPLGVLLPFGVRLAPASPAATPLPGRTVSIARCGVQECAAVADLRPQDLAALDHGGGLLVSYCMLASDPWTVTTGLAQRGCEIDRHTVLSGAGFRAAIAAALGP